MAFFDDLGRKLSQAGQTTIQKTKEMADIAKINSIISDEEKAVNNNYYEIGKLYVSLHSSDYEEEFSSMIQSIYDSEAKINEYRQEIQAIKGVVQCKECGVEVASNVTFCSSCGAQMSKMQMKECPNCVSEMDMSLDYCTECGTKL